MVYWKRLLSILHTKVKDKKLPYSSIFLFSKLERIRGEILTTLVPLKRSNYGATRICRWDISLENNFQFIPRGEEWRFISNPFVLTRRKIKLSRVESGEARNVWGWILQFFRDSRGARITRRNRAAAPVITRTRVAALRRNRRSFQAAIFRPRNGWPRCTRPSTTTRICTRWTHWTPSNPFTTPPIWKQRYCIRWWWWVKVASFRQGESIESFKNCVSDDSSLSKRVECIDYIVT